MGVCRGLVLSSSRFCTSVALIGREACQIWTDGNEDFRRGEAVSGGGGDGGEWEAERRCEAGRKTAEVNLGTRKIHAWGSA